LARQDHRLPGVAVIGLGRFGSALALELEAGGTEVLGIDADTDVVQGLSGQMTHLVVADSTKEEALRQLSVHEFEQVVVGIGSDIESSILTTSLVLGFGVPNVWAKAISDAHGRILHQLGVGHVIYPEHDMGRRLAHLVRGKMLDFVEFEDNFALVKTTPPAEVIGKPLGETGVRSRHGVTVVAVKHRGSSFTYATEETVLQRGDVIVVAGDTEQVERFAEMSQLTSPKAISTTR
jgi:trk system potassium uptake protein